MENLDKPDIKLSKTNAIILHLKKEMQLNDFKKCVGNHFYTQDNEITDYNHLYCLQTYGENNVNTQHTNTRVKIMLAQVCRTCKHVGTFNGCYLCLHPNNQQYISKEQYQTMPVLISRVPDICFLKETRQRRKIILHIPHSSTFLPETFHVLDGVSLEEEYQRMTDWFTDELFDFDEAEKLIFPYSRLYCDVERFRSDREEVMVKKGMGVCYTRTSYGTELRKVGSKEKVFIKSTIYGEHYKKLDKLVEGELSKNGSALIIDCHSFPNEILAQHNQGDARPDICIGSDSFHTSDALLSYFYEYFENEGFTVDINEPFSGTMVPLKYYKKDKRVQSIMIEVNRKLYLNAKFEQNDNFYKIKELMHTLLKNINEQYQLNHFQ